MEDVARAVGVHDGDREPRGPDDASLFEAHGAVRRQRHRDPRGAAGRERGEPLLHARAAGHLGDEPGVAGQEVDPGPDGVDPVHHALAVHRDAEPGLARPPHGHRRRGRVDAVHVEEPARRDDRPVELVGPDVVGRRPAVEARPEAGVGVDQHDADVADAAAGPKRPAHVDPVPREEPPAEARPVVVAELADVAGPKAEPGARHHRGRDHAPALHLELPERRLGVRHRVAVDDPEEVERVRPQTDDVDRGRRAGGPRVQGGASRPLLDRADGHAADEVALKEDEGHDERRAAVTRRTGRTSRPAPPARSPRRRIASSTGSRRRRRAP